MNNKIIYRRTIEKDLKYIQSLFLKTFNKKISLKFYKNRYFNKNKFSSFVAINNNRIIGHVGFIEYRYGFNKKKIYSRHSSFIDSDFREQGVYKKLCLYSYNQLLKKGINKIITWPNKTNRKYKPHYKNFINKDYFLLFKLLNNNKNQLKIKNNFYKIKNISSLKKHEWNEIKKYNLIDNNLIIKNKNYFETIFKNVFKTKYYLIKYKENNKNHYLFFSKRVLTKKQNFTIDILNYFGEKKIFFKIINLLQTVYFGKKDKFLLQVFISALNKNTLSTLKDFGFIIHKDVFKIVILSKNKVSNKERNYIIRSTIHMSDTDVFINTY